jgi:hypothetical protein
MQRTAETHHNLLWQAYCNAVAAEFWPGRGIAVFRVASLGGRICGHNLPALYESRAPSNLRTRQTQTEEVLPGPSGDRPVSKSVSNEG